MLSNIIFQRWRQGGTLIDKLTLLARPLRHLRLGPAAAGAGSCAQSAGQLVRPQKFFWTVEPMQPIGRWCDRIRGLACDDLRRGLAAFLAVEVQEHARVQLHRRAHRAAVSVLTTSVSQTSEKRVPGSRLVTRTGRLIGTLELRRSAAGELVLCIITASDARSKGHSAARHPCSD